ncbi:MAG: PilZ domain-containing protein [Desulfobacterales bacterium]|nr:MAG: PilZ domain-containing protein [Desulfobacterales bacterium]
MSEERRERRRYQRVYFSKQDELVAMLQSSDRQETRLSARVKDLGAGGVGFTIQRDQESGILPGAQFTIQAIQGSDQLAFITDLKVEVRWVLSLEWLENVGFGCEFVDTPPAVGEAIKKYVETWAEASSPTNA